MLSESSLITEALSGSQAAWFSLVEELRPRLYRTILRLTKNPDDAEEVTQDVLLKVYVKLPTFKGNSSLLTWATRIALNEAFMRFRRSALDTVSLSDEDENGQTLLDKLAEERVAPDGIVDSIALRESLDTIPEDCRQALELHEVEDLDYQQIAERLGCTKGQAKSKAAKARKLMKKRLQ